MNSIEKLAFDSINKDLSNNGIKRLTGKEPIAYSDLVNYSNIDELLGTEKFIVILYQTSSINNGHWVALMVNHKNEIIFFDSYGIKYDFEQQYGATYDKKLPKYLTNLIETDGRTVKYNTFDYQKWGKSSTCGRWSSIAVNLLRKLTLEQFNQLFNTNKSSLLNNGDFMVCLLTLIGNQDLIK